MQRLWTRREGLGLAAVLAMPPLAAASPLHRIVAVGDLHGDFDAWRDIAVAARLVDKAGRWIGGATVLVQTGDVVDRGPDSRKLIQELMRLEREAARDKGRVIALVGNHEAMNMTGDLHYLVPADYAAFTDENSARRRDLVFEANKAAITAANRQHDPGMTDAAIRQAWFDATPLGSIEHRIAWSPTGEIGRWIVTHPAVLLLDDTLFVHGGISPAYAHVPLAEINARVTAALTAQSIDPMAIINDPDGPLWYRGLVLPTAGAAAAAAEPLSQPVTPPVPPVDAQLDALLPAFGARRIVIGHTPILSGIAISNNDRLIRIDTGITRFYGGTLSWLEILDGKLIAHTVARSPTP